MIIHKLQRKPNIKMMQSEKFQCLECDYQATWTRNLAEHQNSEHKEEKIQCTECDY